MGAVWWSGEALRGQVPPIQPLFYQPWCWKVFRCPIPSDGCFRVGTRVALSVILQGSFGQERGFSPEHRQWLLPGLSLLARWTVDGGEDAVGDSSSFIAGDSSPQGRLYPQSGGTPAKQPDTRFAALA